MFMGNILSGLVQNTVYSLGMNFLTSGASDVSFNLGVAKYNVSKDEWDHIWDQNNSTFQNISYFVSLTYLIQDVVALFGGGTNLMVLARKQIFGHSEVRGKDISISIGPADQDFGSEEDIFDNLINDNSPEFLKDFEWEMAYINAQWNGSPQQGLNKELIDLETDTYFKTELYNVNSNLMKKMTKNLNSGYSLDGSTNLIYGYKNGCINFTSKALLYSGVFNFSALSPISSPLLLNFELATRQLIFNHSSQFSLMVK
jgi:hypothetical protein